MFNKHGVQLYALGFLTLFLELALIRYLAGSIWNLGYFPNLVLIGTFVGMGIGFVFHRLWRNEHQSRMWFMGSPTVLALLVFLIAFARPSMPGFDSFSGEIGGEVFFTASPTGTLLSSGALLLCFLGVIVIFLCISQRTAKLFSLFPPLTAYTLDILGSCSGILAFMLISTLTLPAFIWFLLCIPLFLLALGTVKLRYTVFLVGILIASAGVARWQDMHLLWDPNFVGQHEVQWSPYQKVEIANDLDKTTLFVNGVSHQTIRGSWVLTDSFYIIPYVVRAKQESLPPYKNILIIGAGGGNDVAAALANGAEHVDAVDIDPVILEMGKRFNPLHPYDDPRVTLTVDDGRAVLSRSDRKYDLIIFALTDSLVRVSPVGQLRLENYLFTREALARAASLLSPGGDLLLYNYYRRPWLEAKLAGMLKEATGEAPSVLSNSDGLMMLAAGATRTDMRIEANEAIESATDDWPFLYLRERGIPPMYLIAMLSLAGAIVLLLLLVERFGAALTGATKPTIAIRIAFLAMGVAFLLLETKGIIEFSLLFGTTWLNASLVSLAALLLVLAANWCAALLPRRALTIAFILLLSSGIIAYLVPLSILLGVEDGFLRFVLGSLHAFLPIFFANIIFSISFRDLQVAEHIFGWNLLGATLGGIVEYASMLTGYRTLTLVAIALYTLVFLCIALDRRQRKEACDTTLRI